MCGNDGLQARSSFKSQTGTCNYAVLANVHRREGQDAYQADDFMPGLRTAESAATKDADAPPDAEAHSRLISALLGKKE